MLGDDKGGLEDVNQAIMLDPKNADAYASRATAKYNLKDFSGRVADLKMAVSLVPGEQDYKNELDGATKTLSLDNEGGAGKRESKTQRGVCAN